MDAIRVSKVEDVACTKLGNTLKGTIHLTAHHLIFCYDDKQEKEMWVPYPLISSVSCLPQTLQGLFPVTFNTRTFETFSLAFAKVNQATDVFVSVKELTVAPSIASLYAFNYRPSPPLPTNDGWTLYDPRKEFGRMGLGTRTKAWRFTDLNKDYTFCPTYPAKLVIPTRISDATLQYASRYRSKCRIPALAYLHWTNYGSITRSSQPMVGVTQNRSVQDEKLIEAIFHSHDSPDSRASSSPIYGSTATNLIIDARPTVNAVANTAKGAGTENMDHYKDAKKAYLGIDHIHTMRDSLGKVVEALREADTLLASINTTLAGQVSSVSVLDRGALRRSGWLRHISAILEGTLLIAKNVHVHSSHVLIHCSDGWDRTSQLSALSQLCLDPYYRTIKGFEILIEKDWLSFGHKFLDRCGHLSSEKFFTSPSETVNSGSGADAAQAFLASVSNRFASQQHVKETSPVFHQFLESVRQIQRQFPDRFEFNERFLHQIYHHLYSCQFGTFLYNCERERRLGEEGKPPCDKTISIWDFLNSQEAGNLNKNPDYNPSLDDPTRREPGADMGVLLPNPKDVRFWHELYGRTDEEMNGRPFNPQQPKGVEMIGAVDNTEEDSGTSALVFADTPLDEKSSRSMNLASWSTSKKLEEELRESTTTPSSLRSGLSSATAELLPPQNISARTPSPGPQTPNRARAKQPELFSSTAVKSVWGKFSSNATAAFSVVQDAYAGVAKDFMNVVQENPSGERAEGEGTKTSELHGREMLSNWGDTTPDPIQDRTGPNSSRDLSLSRNPWATTTTSQPTLYDDNPWGTVRSSSPYRSGSPLPVDPTIAHPKPKAPLSLPTRKASANLGMHAVRPGNASPSPTTTTAPPPRTKTPPKASSNIDPLGVGPL